MPENFYQTMFDCLKSCNRTAVSHLDPEVWRAVCSDVRKNIPQPVPAAAVPPPQSAPRDAVRDTVRGTGDVSWENLAAAVAGCADCRLHEHRTHPVFGEGNIHAELMFIGEGPGADEDRTGRPFVGKAGQLLDKMIVAMKYDRSDVYIANVVKCRPPGNRTPAPDEAMCCMHYLESQIKMVNPKIIVCLGAVALSYLLDVREGITKIRGRWMNFAGIPVMPTFHPAFLLRQESAKKEAWSDLKQVMRALGKL